MVGYQGIATQPCRTATCSKFNGCVVRFYPEMMYSQGHYTCIHCGWSVNEYDGPLDLSKVTFAPGTFAPREVTTSEGDFPPLIQGRKRKQHTKTNLKQRTKKNLKRFRCIAKCIGRLSIALAAARERAYAPGGIGYREAAADFYAHCGGVSAVEADADATPEVSMVARIPFSTLRVDDPPFLPDHKALTTKRCFCCLEHKPRSAYSNGQWNLRHARPRARRNVELKYERELSEPLAERIATFDQAGEPLSWRKCIQCIAQTKCLRGPLGLEMKSSLQPDWSFLVDPSE